MFRILYFYLLFCLSLSLGAQQDSQIKLQIKPDRVYFDKGSVMWIDGPVKNGTVISDALTRIITPSKKMIRDNHERHYFKKEGVYSLMAFLPELEQAERIIVVDDTEPVVEIKEPKEGAYLDYKEQVQIKSEISDGVSGPARGAIAGQNEQFFEATDNELVNKNGQEAFSKRVNAVHGLNVVNVHGEDVAGLSAKDAVSFMQSGQYLNFNSADPLGNKITEAIEIEVKYDLLKGIVDNLERPESIQEILDNLIQKLDLNDSAEPKLIFESNDSDGTFFYRQRSKAWLHGIKFRNPVLNAEIVDGGLNVSGGFIGNESIAGVEVKLKLIHEAVILDLFKVKMLEGFLTIHIDALGAIASIHVSKKLGSNLIVNVSNIQLEKGYVEVIPDISLSSYDFRDHLPFLQKNSVLRGLFPMTASEYINQVVGKILTDMGSDKYAEFKPEIEDILESNVNVFLVNMLKKFEVSTQFSTDTFPWAATSRLLTLETAIDALRIERGVILMGLKTGIMSDGVSAHDEAPVVLRNNCEEEAWPENEQNEEDGLRLTDETNIWGSLKLDFINQLSHALWQGGAFDINIDTNTFRNLNLVDFGITNLQGEIFLDMAPLLNDCNNEDMYFEVGNILLRAAFRAFEKDYDVKVKASLRAGLDIFVENDEFHVVLSSTELLSFVVTDVITGVASDKPIIETLVENYLKEPIENELKGIVLFKSKLPEFYPSEVDPGFSEDEKIVFSQVNLGYGEGRFAIKAKLSN